MDTEHFSRSGVKKLPWEATDTKKTYCMGLSFFLDVPPLTIVYRYRVSRQVLDSLIECDNPIGLWWVWVAYPKTTIPYQDGCLPQPSGTKPFLKNPNNCYSPNNLNNCYNPNNFSHFGHYIFQRQLINQVNVGMGGGTQYHGTMVPQDYTKN